MEEQKQKSWFARNWPWAVPVGGCLTLIIVVSIMIGVAVVKMPELLNNVEPIQHGITQTMSNDDVREAIGEPIEVDRYGETEGTFDIKNDNSEINMTFPLKGPKGTASLIIRGAKENDQWTYSELYVEIHSSGTRINLLESTSNDL